MRKAGLSFSIIAASAILLLALLIFFLRLQPKARPKDQSHLQSRDELARNVSGNITTFVPYSGFPSNISLPDSQFFCSTLEFRDPFYAFVIGIAEGDSLGLWTKYQLDTFLNLCEKKSNLPLEYFSSLERSAADITQSEFRRGVKVERIWRLTLKEPLDYPMPYSILGYDLGSLSIARVLTFSEWRLGNRNVHAPSGKEISVIPVTGLTVLRLDTGWIVLDANGLVDKLLGGKLDDCWTQGFAICRQGGEIRGLALSLNRKLRSLCGEIDFTSNEITPTGSPFTRGVAVYVRPWLAPPDGTPARTWQFD